MRATQKLELLKIVSFLKENTIVVTITTATLYALAYLYQILIFKKWQISPETIERVSPQFMFIIVSGIVYSFSASVHQLFLLTKFKQVAPTYFVNSFLHKTLRRYKNTEQLNEKQIDLVSIVAENCKDIKKKVLRYITTSLILSFLFFFPFYAVFYITFLNFDLLEIIVSFSFYTIISIIFLFLFTSSSARRILRTKKMKFKTINNPDTIFNTCYYLANHEAARLRDEIDVLNNKNTFTDYSRIIFPTIITFLLMLAVRFIQPLTREYWCFTYNNIDYVIVYQSGQTTISKQAKIDNEHNLVILLNEQLRIDTYSINIKYTRFQSVRTSTNNE